MLNICHRLPQQQIGNLYVSRQALPGSFCFLSVSNVFYHTASSDLLCTWYSEFCKPKTLDTYVALSISSCIRVDVALRIDLQVINLSCTNPGVALRLCATFVTTKRWDALSKLEKQESHDIQQGRDPQLEPFMGPKLGIAEQGGLIKVTKEFKA